MIGEKFIRPHLFQEWVVHHLNRPDQPDKGTAAGKVNDKERDHDE